MAGGLVTDLVTSFSLVPLTSRKDVTRLNTAIQHVEPPPTTLGRKINPHGPPVVPDPVRLGLGRYRRSAPYDTFTIDALTTKMVSRQVSHVVRRPTKRTPNPTCFQIPTCPPGDARDNATIPCPPTFHPLPPHVLCRRRSISTRITIIIITRCAKHAYCTRVLEYMYIHICTEVRNF